jgi:predicted small integral membrane protein
MTLDLDDNQQKPSPAGSPLPEEEVIERVVQTTGRKGFLPIRTNTFDRYFISVVVLVAVHLLWLRFLEQFLPLMIATALTIVMGYFIVRYG